MTDYTSVKVPRVLADIIVNSEIYKHYGYRSVSEFILACARQRIEEYDKVEWIVSVKNLMLEQVCTIQETSLLSFVSNVDYHQKGDHNIFTLM